jgi:c-di-GMP-binding flagellar brake protein YcgR
MQERRDLGRWTICNKVCYRKAGGESECECVSKDISTRGIRLAAAEELKPDTELEMRIHLAEGLNPVLAKGKVVWQAPDQESEDRHFNTGIFFDTIKDNDREEIYKYAYQYKRDEIVNRWWQGTQ